MSGTPPGRPLWIPFAALVGGIAVVDQATKAWISTELAAGRRIDVIDGLVRLVYTENSGALFGMFQGQVTLFALLSLVVIGVIVGIHARSGRSAYMTLTLGLLLGGAVGNAIDRLRLGFVVDFVDGGIGSLRFYTFNIGDACISLAIVLLLAMAIWPSLAGASGGPGEGTPAAPTATGESGAAGESRADGA